MKILSLIFLFALPLKAQDTLHTFTTKQVIKLADTLRYCFDKIQAADIAIPKLLGQRSLDSLNLLQKDVTIKSQGEQLNYSVKIAEDYRKQRDENAPNFFQSHWYAFLIIGLVGGLLLK